MTDEEKMENEKFESEALDEWAMINDENYTFSDIEKLHEEELKASL